MDTSYSPLRRTSASDLARLKEEMNKTNSNQREADKRFWAPERDQAGNAYAVIRFLPEINEGEVPYVKVWDHGFKGPGGWYIEKSLTTLGMDDPVSELNSSLWNTGIEANKEIARKQKRRLKFYSNVYVVSDPKNPENEGKVFIWMYGKKVFEKINAMMNPNFQDEKQVYPFDWYEGANFKVKIWTDQKSKFPQYDKCEFEEPSQLADEKTMLRIAAERHDLSEFVDFKRGGFKVYDTLKKRLHKVLGLDDGAQSGRSREDDEVEDTPPWEHKPSRGLDTKPAVETTPLRPAVVMDSTSPVNEASAEADGDDELEFFKKVAAEAAARDHS